MSIVKVELNWKMSETVRDLRLAYEKAVENKQEIFQIADYKFVTGYAKYLLQYLEMKRIHESRELKTFMSPNAEVFDK